MNLKDAIEYVKAHDDEDDLDQTELAEAFEALHGRKADAEDEAVGLWSFCVLAADDISEDFEAV